MEEVQNKITLDAPPVRNIEDYPNIQYQIKGQDSKQYNLKIYQTEKNIMYVISVANDILNIKYKSEFNLQEFHYLNRIFRQYISLEELFNLYFKSLKENEIIINKQDKNIKLSLLIEFRGQKEEIIFILNPTNIQYEQALISLNEKINNIELLFKKEQSEKIELNKKIKTLEENLDKKDIIINNLIERIYNLEKQIQRLNDKKETSKFNIDSVIIKSNELNLIEEGIKHNFNKSIRNFELLIRGSKDGFTSNDFHNKCDNKNFTVTFVETTDGRRFGGFTEEYWDQSDKWKTAPKSFIFSLDNKEIYYCNEGKDAIYCYPNKNPNFLGFGKAHDFKLCDNCDKNYICYDSSGNSFNTNGKNYALAGKHYFCVKDYEVHKIYLI